MKTFLKVLGLLAALGFVFILARVIGGCLVTEVHAANDSLSVYYDTVSINWKRSVASITRDTGTKNVTLILFNHQNMTELQPDTTNGIGLNIYGANNIWPKKKQLADSMDGDYSMKDLIDTIFTHAGKYLKKQVK